MHPFLQALLGGLLLGGAALLLMGTIGRTAGISGIVSGLWKPSPPRGWQAASASASAVATAAVAAAASARS